MTYETLKMYFRRFQLGRLSKLELAFAIGLWQRGGIYGAPTKSSFVPSVTSIIL